MKGLYIIEEVIKELPSKWGTIGFFSFLIFMIFSLIFWQRAMLTFSDFWCKFWEILMGISLTFMLIVPLICFGKVPTYTAYKAIITPEINQENFNKKYEIIDKENDIYIIKEIK